MKQTQMYVCTLEEFILVEIFWLLYKLELIWNENYAGIYTNLWIDVIVITVTWQVREVRITFNWETCDIEIWS